MISKTCAAQTPDRITRLTPNRRGPQPVGVPCAAAHYVRFCSLVTDGWCYRGGRDVRASEPWAHVD
jgi:hypothetical protein